MKERKKYIVGIYCRLSKDDDIRNGESSSISTQKEMLEKYVKSNALTHNILPLSPPYFHRNISSYFESSLCQKCGLLFPYSGKERIST